MFSVLCMCSSPLFVVLCLCRRSSENNGRPFFLLQGHAKVYLLHAGGNGTAVYVRYTYHCIFIPTLCFLFPIEGELMAFDLDTTSVCAIYPFCVFASTVQVPNTVGTHRLGRCFADTDAHFSQ